MNNYENLKETMKSLDFKLIPVGETANIVNDKNYFDQAKDKAEKVKRVEEMSDMYIVAKASEYLKALDYDFDSLDKELVEASDDNVTFNENIKRAKIAINEALKPIMDEISDIPTYLNETLYNWINDDEKKAIIKEFETNTSRFRNYIENKRVLLDETEANNGGLKAKSISERTIENFFIYRRNLKQVIYATAFFRNPQYHNDKADIFDLPLDMYSYNDFLSKKGIINYNRMVGLYNSIRGFYKQKYGISLKKMYKLYRFMLTGLGKTDDTYSTEGEVIATTRGKLEDVLQEMDAINKFTKYAESGDLEIAREALTYVNRFTGKKRRKSNFPLKFNEFDNPEFGKAPILTAERISIAHGVIDSVATMKESVEHILKNEETEYYINKFWHSANTAQITVNIFLNDEGEGEFYDYLDTLDNLFKDANHYLKKYNSFLQKKNAHNKKFQTDFGYQLFGNKGWTNGKNDTNLRANRLTMFKDSEDRIYVGVMIDKTLPMIAPSKTGTYERLVVNNMVKAYQTIPRLTFKRKAVVEHFATSDAPYTLGEDCDMETPLTITKDIYDTYSNRLFTSEAKKSGAVDEKTFRKNLNVILTFYKDFLNSYKLSKCFNYSFKDVNDYKDLGEFGSSVDACSYKQEWIRVADEDVELAINSGKMLLYKLDSRYYQKSTKSTQLKYLDMLINNKCAIGGGTRIYFRGKEELKVTHKTGSYLLNKKFNDGTPIPRRLSKEVYDFLNNHKPISDEAKKAMSNMTYKKATMDITKNNRYGSDSTFISLLLLFNSKKDITKNELNELINEDFTKDMVVSFNNLAIADIDGNSIDLGYVNDCHYETKLIDYIATYGLDSREVSKLKEGYITGAVSAICKLALDNNRRIILNIGEENQFFTKENRLSLALALNKKLSFYSNKNDYNDAPKTYSLPVSAKKELNGQHGLLIINNGSSNDSGEKTKKEKVEPKAKAKAKTNKRKKTTKKAA